MLDFRLNTFLILCETLNFTRAAEKLHITQPAVSGHIKYLENHYGFKLFNYKGKTLFLTPEGKALHQFVATLEADTIKEIESLKHLEMSHPVVHFGATLTIGEYVMPPLLGAYLNDYASTEIHMHVDNTQSLLASIDNGHLDFAFIEGYFDKARFCSKLFSHEKFLAVCSPEHPLAYQETTFDRLFKERLIVREKGSGSRDILEQALYEKHASIEDFTQMMELGNLHAIKHLTLQNYGITFLYEIAVKDELMQKKLAPIYIKDFDLIKAFYFICPKTTVFKNQYLILYEHFKSNYANFLEKYQTP